MANPVWLNNFSWGSTGKLRLLVWQKRIYMAVLACSSVCFLASFRKSRDCENNMPRYLYLSVENYFWHLTVVFCLTKMGQHTLPLVQSNEYTAHRTYIANSRLSLSNENMAYRFAVFLVFLVYLSSGAIWLWPWYASICTRARNKRTGQEAAIPTGGSTHTWQVSFEIDIRTTGLDKHTFSAWNWEYFLTHNFIICFGCSKEPSHWDGSSEYPQHMFGWYLRQFGNKSRCHRLELMNYDVLQSLNIAFILENSGDSDEMLQSLWHGILGLHCMSKYLFRGFYFTN